MPVLLYPSSRLVGSCASRLQGHQDEQLFPDEASPSFSYVVSCLYMRLGLSIQNLSDFLHKCLIMELSLRANFDEEREGTKHEDIVPVKEW